MTENLEQLAEWQLDDKILRPIYDAALRAENEATGATTPGYARRSAYRAMRALRSRIAQGDRG